MKARSRVARNAFLQFTSVAGEGFQLEILAGDGGSGYIRPEPLARIVSDDNELQWFEFYTPEGVVRLPVPEIARAIQVASEDVHGEAWYDGGDAKP